MAQQGPRSYPKAAGKLHHVRVNEVKVSLLESLFLFAGFQNRTVAQPRQLGAQPFKAFLRGGVVYLHYCLKFSLLKGKLAATEQNAGYVGGISEDGFQAAYRNMKAILTEDVILGRTAFPPEPSVLGFGIAVPEAGRQNVKKPYIVLSRNGADYPIDMGQSSAGNARRVVNFLKRFHELPKRIGEQRDECLREIEHLMELDRAVDEPLAHQGGDRQDGARF